MALRLGQARGEDVADLIARKQYAKAIDIIKEQLKSQRSDARIRLQLADVLVMAGRPPEAVSVLIPLADEYARDGFAAKAVAVLKRIQKIEPQRRDIESRLASLIEAKQRQATVPIASSPSRVEFGFEEIQPGMELELGIEPLEEASVPAEPALPARAAAPPPPVEDRDLAFGDGPPLELVVEPEPPAPPEPEPAAEPEMELAFEPAPAPLRAPVPAPEPEIVLELEPVIEPEPEVEPVIEAEPVLEAEPDDLFAQELMSVLEDAFPGPAPEAEPDASAPTSDGDPSSPPAGGGRQIVVSPLFRDFSVDELVAVIQGLRLLSFEAGEIIISEGEPGDSLYMLSAGRVKAFKRNPAGKQGLLGEMSEGAFFGEISVLTGKPRSATVVAATTCELLELDRGTLQEITATHPHVWDVLREYADRRMKSQK